MAPLNPETATSPMAEAPPDRPTLRLEQWARQGEALLFGDNKLDDDERAIFYGFVKRVAMRAAAQGGIGLGAGTPPAGAEPGMPPPSPGEMNANTEDMGTVEGATPEGEY